MNAINLLSGNPYQPLEELGELGKLCIFGCKAQRAADKKKKEAQAADKVQAESLELMRVNNAETAAANVALIAEKQAETKKKTIIIASVGGGILLLLGIVYAVKKSKKKK